jgi:hypothetical protein
MCVAFAVAVSLLDEAQEKESNDELRATLNRTLRQLARARAKTDDLVEAVYRAAGDAITAHQSPTHKPRADRRTKGAEAALWHLTDWQGAKVTTSYNRDVMWQRVHTFVDKAEHITNIQRTEHPVNHVTILFGGDMVEGLFNFPTQPFEVDATLFEQWVSVSRLLGEVVTRALGIYDTVQVVPEWGNHGRIGSKRDAVPRSDNVDRMCYETARQLLSHEKRLVWLDCPEDIQRVEIGNYRAVLMHGDETGRNGFVSPNTFKNYLAGLRSGAYGWDFSDVYTGHYHTHNEHALRDGRGAWYQTGSTESDNRYARDGMGAAAQPSQRLHFIHPELGRVTAQYKIQLD